MDEDRQPLNYAKPEPIGPPASKVLGMTAAVVILLPLGFILGLAVPLIMFSGLSSAFPARPGNAILFFFIGMIGLTAGVIYAVLKSNTPIRVFLAMFSIGAVLTTLALSACGFH